MLRWFITSDFAYFFVRYKWILLVLFRLFINIFLIFSLFSMVLFSLILPYLCINFGLNYNEIIWCYRLTLTIYLGHDIFDIFSLELWTVCNITKIVFAEDKRVPQSYTVLRFECLKPELILILKGEYLIPNLHLLISHLVEFFFVYLTTRVQFKLDVIQLMLLIIHSFLCLKSKNILQDRIP